MKAIIYAGIGLFSAASVYGVVDYFNDSQKGRLKDLYREEEIAVEAKKGAKENEAVLNTIAVSKEKPTTNAVLQKKKVKKKVIKKIHWEDFSRGKIMPPVIEEELVPESKIIEMAKPEMKLLTEVEPVPEKIAEVSVVKEKRKISLENFSRAPLKNKKVSRKTKE